MNRLHVSLLIPLLLFTGYIPCLANQPASNKSLLWQVSGKDLDKPSFLFGTIHLICPDDYIWTDKMEWALQKAEEVCFEMDMDDPSVMMAVAEGLVDNSGKTLEDYFSPADYKKLSKYIRDTLGMSVTMFSTMKPAILPVIFSGKSPHCKMSVSYEDKIMQAAKEDKKSVQGLEKPEEQIALFNTLPTDSLIKDIMDIVNGTQEEDSTYYKLIAAYTSQDLPEIFRLLHASSDLGSKAGAFIDERNIKWIPRMVDMMDQKSVFFAVGAGHLWGGNGVINLLRQEGYTVTPLK